MTNEEIEKERTLVYERAASRLAAAANFSRSPDGTNRLCVLLYGDEDVRKYVGGSNAPMLHDAADEITRLRKENERLRMIVDSWQAAKNAEVTVWPV